jgi:hypothetical protein
MMAKDNKPGSDSNTSTEPVEPQPVGQPYPAPTQPDTGDNR